MSLLLMFPLLLASAFAFKAEDISTRNALVATFLVLYVLAYSPGMGICPFLYSSEVFPQVVRGKSCIRPYLVSRRGGNLLAGAPFCAQS